MQARKFGATIFIFLFLSLISSGYFIFAALQGDYGLFRRLQIMADAQELQKNRDMLQDELNELQNRTNRLSDHFLDLDLLDEQVRSILGYIRADEIVIP